MWNPTPVYDSSEKPIDFAVSEHVDVDLSDQQINVESSEIQTVDTNLEEKQITQLELLDQQMNDISTEEQIENKSSEQPINDESSELLIDEDISEQQIDDDLTDQQIDDDLSDQQVDDNLSEQQMNVETSEQPIADNLIEQQINDESSQLQNDMDSPEQQMNIELTEQITNAELTEQENNVELNEQQISTESFDQQQINVQSSPSKDQNNHEKTTDEPNIISRSLKRRRVSDDSDEIKIIQQDVHQNEEKNQENILTNNTVTSSTEAPEWFINNIKQIEENQSNKLKELKDEIFSELNHQFGNTHGKIIKNDKQQFEKQILRAMKQCFIEVENEISIKNLTLLNNNNNNNNENKENNNNVVDNNDDDKEEGEIDNEEKTDSQKDDELIIKLNNIFNNLTENDSKKIYGLLSNLKVSTKKGVENVTNIFFNKAIEMPKLSYDLVDRLIHVTDFDPAFLHLREYLFKRCENDLANGNIINEIIFVSFIAKKGYLLPDEFISRCIYCFLEIENKQNIECICKFINIAGEYYRNFPFIIDCFNKFEIISATGKYGKDITNEINQLIYRKNMLWQ